MVHHIQTVKKAGINPVVCINSFYKDTKDEIAAVRRLSEAAGARVAVSEHWLKGGDGALEFADAVVDACEEKNQFKLLYDLSLPLRQRIELIAKEVYGADGVSYTPDAEAKAKRMEADTCVGEARDLHGQDTSQPVPRSEHKGNSQGMDTPIRDILTYNGAGFVVPVAGAISLMPGTGSDPAFRRIDVDVETGKVKGLF